MCLRAITDMNSYMCVLFISVGVIVEEDNNNGCFFINEAIAYENTNEIVCVNRK